MAIKLSFAKMTLLAALLFGKERPSARAEEMGPRPCWLRLDQRAAPTGRADAPPGAEAPGGGRAGRGRGAEARPPAPVRGFGDRPVSSRGGSGSRRPPMRRRLRRGRQRSLRQARRRPGRRPR